MKVLTVLSRKLFWIVVAMVYGLKVIGLAPFSVETATTYPAFAGTRRIRVFRHSKIGLIYNSILAFSIFVVIAFILPYFGAAETSLIQSSSNSVLTGLIGNVLAILYVIASCLSIMTWAFRQRKAASVLNRLLEIDVQLSDWNNPPWKKKTLVVTIVHLIINSYILVSSLVIQFMYINFRSFIMSSFMHFPICIIYFFTVEYFTVVGLIAGDIESVNIKLMNLIESGNHLTNSQRLVINPASHKRIQLASLMVFKNIRMTLSELCEDVAEFFSLPILFCIASSVTPLSALLYHLIVYTNSPKNDVIEVGAMAAYTFTATLIFVYPMTSLAFNVTKTVHEAKRTRRIIVKLMADDELMTEETKAELELFSRWVADECLDFTAFGFFTLDSSLLLSVLGTTTTYLIILIQFWSSGVDNNRV